MPIGTLTLLAASVFAAITTEVLPVGVLPLISHDLGTSTSRVGLLVSAYAIVVAVGSIPLTGLIEGLPRRAVLCGLLALYAVSNTMMAVAGDYGVALVARLLGGLAHAGYFAAVFTAAVSVVPPGRVGRAMAIVGAGNAVGLAFGVPVGTALAAAVGWRWAFAVCAGMTLVLAVLVVVVLPPPRSPRPADHVRVLTAVRGGPILLVAAVVIVLTLGHYLAYTYVSVLLIHAGVATNALSVALFGYGAAGFVGLLLAGTVVDRRPRLALQGAIALTTLCLLAIGLTHATAPTIALVALWGLAFGMLPTLIQAVALRAAPNAPDAAPAVVNSTFNVGISGGALIGSTELLAAGPPVLPLSGAALTAAALLLLLAGRLRSISP